MSNGKCYIMKGKRSFALLLLFPLLSGCSISGRTSVDMDPLQSPVSPVLKDVYDRSVEKDVYAPGGRGERLFPDPVLEPESMLKDKL
ncbi:hypothetical protein [Paenibacillus sp. DMB20]|uniref:hypothetical protein n=1 Tax=Paenibacillus sp. DMB20 TaxID=1642570 RepID=UPI000A52AC67|nr:hypothetical protein [Paenibacillus sp. DMB20]